MTEELDPTRAVAPASPPPLVEPPAPPRAVPPRLAPADEPLPADATPPAGTAPPAPAGPYRLRMPDGVVVDLDLTVYLGRKPSVPRVAHDRRVRLVRVPSPQKEVSATHLELRRSGEAMVATDMRSTNGSLITVPGAPPRTLLRGESAVVIPGARIDIGDGNVLEVLPPAGAAEPGA